MTIIVGVGHKPLFEDSPSECGGGATTMWYGLISKWHSQNKIHMQDCVMCNHWLEPKWMSIL